MFQYLLLGYKRSEPEGYRVTLKPQPSADLTAALLPHPQERHRVPASCKQHIPTSNCCSENTPPGRNADVAEDQGAGRRPQHSQRAAGEEDCRCRPPPALSPPAQIRAGIPRAGRAPASASLRAERPRQPNRAGPGPPWLRLRPQSNPAPPAPGIQVQPTGASGPRPAESTCAEPKPSTAPTCPRVHPSTCRVSREWSPGSVQRELRPQGQPDRCQTQTFCPEVRPQPPPAAKAMIGSTGSFFRKFKSKSTGRNRGLPEEPE